MKGLLILSVFLIGGSFALPIDEEVTSHRWNLVPDGEGRMHLVDMNPYEVAPEPSFNADRDTFYLLFTRRNRLIGTRITNTVASVSGSNWNSAAAGTRFIIHGWTQDARASLNRDITSAYLSSGDHNVVGMFVNLFFI